MSLGNLSNVDYQSELLADKAQLEAVREIAFGIGRVLDSGVEVDVSQASTVKLGFSGEGAVLSFLVTRIVLHISAAFPLTVQRLLTQFDHGAVVREDISLLEAVVRSWLGLDPSDLKAVATILREVLYHSQTEASALSDGKFAVLSEGSQAIALEEFQMMWQV